VFLGEATHGTHEFYHARAEISLRLIREKGFEAIATEADWPDAARVNRFVQAAHDDEEAIDALSDFRRFPTWMWRNADVLELVGELRDYNEQEADPSRKVGWFGLDLYSLFRSIEMVLQHLEHIDPKAAQRARKRYACFEHFSKDAQRYGHETGSGAVESCEETAVQQLLEIRRQAAEWRKTGSPLSQEELFYAEQNARLVKNAEEYYRTMLFGHVDSWNLRDQHMMETLEEVAAHLERQGRRGKVIVWAHNSHLGDARATEMADRGEWNLGQLARQKFGDDVVLVGFTTHHGTVTAASDWSMPAERKRVRPALLGSIEELFHETELGGFYLDLNEQSSIARALQRQFLERAIGVVYLPSSERYSHYFHTAIARQFDAIFHYDSTRALEPLERTATWLRGEVPETYPYAV
jgi:erythromycin esterase-like protein